MTLAEENDTRAGDDAVAGGPFACIGEQAHANPAGSRRDSTASDSMRRRSAPRGIDFGEKKESIKRVKRQNKKDRIKKAE